MILARTPAEERGKMRTIGASLALWQALAEELHRKINPDVADHWERKILEGIVPTEVKRRGLVDMDHHNREAEKLVNLEANTVLRLYENQWKPAPNNRGTEIHYFGIGTGRALARVARIANIHGDHVIAYDVCPAGYNAGNDAFRDSPKGTQNRVLFGDILNACKIKYIRPGWASKIIASRVLDVLDRQEWGKMERTARRLGRLSSFVDILIMYPCPEDNLNAIWGDTTPHPLEEVVGYMQEGRGDRKLEVTKEGSERFHGHVYTEILIRGK